MRKQVGESKVRRGVMYKDNLFITLLHTQRARLNGRPQVKATPNIKTGTGFGHKIVIIYSWAMKPLVKIKPGTRIISTLVVV